MSVPSPGSSVSAFLRAPVKTPPRSPKPPRSRCVSTLGPTWYVMIGITLAAVAYITYFVYGELHPSGKYGNLETRYFVQQCLDQVRNRPNGML